jgi:hypothetical protein
MQKATVPKQFLVMLDRAAVDGRELLVLVTKVTLQVSHLLAHDTILLGHTTNLLGKGLDLLGITTKTAPLSCNDALGVMLQLEQVLGIARHVHPTTMVVVLKDVARLIHVFLPLWVGAVMDRVHGDRRAHSGRQVLRAQGDECQVSSLLHGVVHIIPDDPRGPQALVRKHVVGWDIDIDLAALQVVLLVESPIVLKNLVPVASLHNGIPQQ